MKLKGRLGVQGVARFRFSALGSGPVASIAVVDLGVRISGIHPPLCAEFSTKNRFFCRWLPSDGYLSYRRNECPLWVTSSRSDLV